VKKNWNLIKRKS